MSKRYKCPQCEYRGTKEQLITHFEDKHEECIPEGFTAGRVIFNHINKKTHGVCVVCKRETEWNENTLKYNRLCGRKECKESLRKHYQKNMIRVRGTDNILNDIMQQELMLKNRKISGKYKFTDGGVHIYTGTYEKQALEFLDKVLHFTSDDILAPGPIIEYEFEGKKLKYISDIYLIPFNLIIEVKDGGDNKNNRPMKSYRDKQIAKEDAVKKLDTFNYLRLTNNNFAQLLEIIVELKYQSMDETEDKRAIINIHEEVNALCEKANSMDSNKIAMKLGLAKSAIKRIINSKEISDKYRAYGTFVNDKGTNAKFIRGEVNMVKVWSLTKKWTMMDRFKNLLFGNEYYTVKKLLAKEVLTNDKLDPVEINWIGPNICVTMSKKTMKSLKEDTSINESIGSYDDAKKVFESLDRNVQLWVCPSGRYVDSDKVIFRKVLYKDNNPIGFIDCYDFDPEKNNAFVIYAIKPEHQGHGLSQLMLKVAADECSKLGMRKMIYRVDKDNFASIKAAIKFGFEKVADGKEQLVFEFNLKGWK